MSKFVAFDMLNSFENCGWFVLKAITITINYNSAFFFPLFTILSASYPIKYRKKTGVGFSQCKTW